jgi:hypothetical protein
MTIRSYLDLSLPKQVYIPYWLANIGKTGVEYILKALRRCGLRATMPPELMFLDNFYKPQTLCIDKLASTSFVDPMPDETIFTRLPEMLIYYLTRWSHENLITSFRECGENEKSIASTFANNPQSLIAQVHANRPPRTTKSIE